MDRHLTIVTPVFNDWESFCCLARSLDEIAAQLDTLISVLAVDDGSTNLPTMLAPEAFFHLKSVERILLRCNVGHQRAIAIGLSECLRRNDHPSSLSWTLMVRMILRTCPNFSRHTARCPTQSLWQVGINAPKASLFAPDTRSTNKHFAY